MLIMAGVVWGVPILGRVPFGMREVQQDFIGNFVSKDSAFLALCVQHVPFTSHWCLSEGNLVSFPSGFYKIIKSSVPVSWLRSCSLLLMCPWVEVFVLCGPRVLASIEMWGFFSWDWLGFFGTAIFAQSPSGWISNKWWLWLVAFSLYSNYAHFVLKFIFQLPWLKDMEKHRQGSILGMPFPSLGSNPHQL